jgi:RNA polymerase sigma factor (sigma-70 family)
MKKLETDSQIVDAIRAGGNNREIALGVVYNRRVILNNIQNYLRGNKGSFHDAEDLFMDSMVVFDRNVREGKFLQQSSINHYIVSIGKYLWMNKLRKQKRIILEEDNTKLDGVMNVNPEDIMISSEQKEFLHNWLESLGKKCEGILKLWMLHYSMEEIAIDLELPNAASARKTKYKCMQKLIKLVKGKA